MNELSVCVPTRRALYYQRRWVKLDVDYLRYFDNEKVMALGNAEYSPHICITEHTHSTLSPCVCVSVFVDEGGVLQEDDCNSCHHKSHVCGRAQV